MGDFFIAGLVWVSGDWLLIFFILVKSAWFTLWPRIIKANKAALGMSNFFLTVSHLTMVTLHSGLPLSLGGFLTFVSRYWSGILPATFIFRAGYLSFPFVRERYIREYGGHMLYKEFGVCSYLSLLLILPHLIVAPTSPWKLPLVGAYTIYMIIEIIHFLTTPIKRCPTKQVVRNLIKAIKDLFKLIKR